jgi:hypothetical protein
MEAVLLNKRTIFNSNFQEVLSKFFIDNSPEAAQLLFWKVFQCWTIKDCNLKAEISDEEVALFFDQLIDLVAAAYMVHQENRVSETKQEGSGHE